MSTSMVGKERPILLVVLVIVSALVGAAATVIGLNLIVAGLNVAPGPMGQIGALFGAMVFVPGVVELLVAYGLWKLKRWGWWLGVIVHVLAPVWVVLTSIDPMLLSLYMLIAVGLLAFVACLFTPQVRRAFWPVT